MDNKENREFPDILVHGLTGSGKDTIANYYKAYYDYRKMRLAGTIKQVICEKFDLTEEELEVVKRTDPEMRLEHHRVSDNNGGQNSSLNRAGQIANRTAFELSIVNDKEKQIVVCDGRSFEEAQVLLSHNFVVIFLSRTTQEFRDSTHFTENNLFLNGQLAELTNHENGMFIDNIIVVFNDTNYTNEKRAEIIENFHEDTKVLLLSNSVSGEGLIEKLDEFLIDNNIFKD